MPIWDIKRGSREASRKTEKEDTVITREQAVKFSESSWWEGKTACEITALQLYESRLCMPEFQMFHEAVEVGWGGRYSPTNLHLSSVCKKNLKKSIPRRPS